jgi:hypothetical protein
MGNVIVERMRSRPLAVDVDQHTVVKQFALNCSLVR